MDIPEDLQKLLEEMGASLMRAVSEDARCLALAAEIREQGWDLGLTVEATLSLHPRADAAQEEEGAADGEGWSEADRELLRTFRIRMDE